MGRVTLYDIEDTTRVLEFLTLEENENVEIETQDINNPSFLEMMITNK